MSDQSPFGDDLELRLVRRPEGSHRSKSTGTPGAERDLLRDKSGALLGPTESFPVDLNELRDRLGRSDATPPDRPGQVRSAGRQMAVDIATDVAYIFLREAVAQVYDLVIAPKAKAKWAQLKRRRSPVQGDQGKASSRELLAAELPPVEEPSTDLAPKLVVVMDSVEFRQRLALMLAAENFAAEQRQLLSSAQVSDEADLPPQLASAMKLVLEEGTASLDDQSLQLLLDFLTSSDAELVEPLERHEPQARELDPPHDLP